MADDDPTAEVAMPATVSVKTGAIITLVAALLGTGGSTGVLAMLQQPNDELIERLEAIEERIEAQETAQRQATRLSGVIYKTIIRAHPDAAIPLEDLEWGLQ